MPKRPNARKIFRKVVRIGHPQAVKTETKADELLIRAASNRIYSYIERAFQLAGRDITSEDDWVIVMGWLALSVLAGRDPGHPIKWTRKAMERLIRDFEREKARRRLAKLPENQLACCGSLLKQPPYDQLKGKHYGSFKPSALRRRLVDARTMMRTLKMVEAGQAGSGQ